MDRSNPLVRHVLDLAETRLGMTEVARRLEVPVEAVRAWRDGHIVLPEHKLLALVDVIAGRPPA
jgi:DNA-binding transcriptional regulator YiaG